MQGHIPVITSSTNALKISFCFLGIRSASGFSRELSQQMWFQIFLRPSLPMHVLLSASFFILDSNPYTNKHKTLIEYIPLEHKFHHPVS